MEFRTKYTNGHTETILCLCANTTDNIASGSENNELCLWDQTRGALVHKSQSASGNGDVTSLCFSKTQPYNLYCSVDSHIYLYDTRCMENSVAKYEYNKEEINQLALHPKDSYLAACDDSGQIRIIDVNQRKLYKTLRKHTNICSSVTFHPKLPWHLTSGGLDCNIFTWDFSRARVYSSFSTQDINFEDASSVPSTYSVNPPLVHSIQYSLTGDVACGLENSSVVLYEFPKRSTIRVKRILRGHTKGVSQVCYHGDELLSAGNDGKIILWNTEKQVENSLDGKSDGQSLLASDSAESGTESDIGVEVDHGDKVNWLCPVQSGDEKLLYVADQTDAISVYKINGRAKPE